MSENNNVTATIDNQTTYTLNYDSNNVSWGYVTTSGPDNSTVIPPGSQLQVFYAWGAEGSGTGCQGNLTYGFTDQNNNSQELTLFYKDPYNLGTDNEFSATVPSGLTCTNNGPTHGDSVAVTYTISGSVS
jgi:hypothetical protein